MNNTITDKERIKVIDTNIDFCVKNSKNVDIKEFKENIKLQYSLVMALQIICENTNHLSIKTKNLDSSIPWNHISKTRNIISHEYGQLNLDMTLETIKTDLPDLQLKLKKVYKELEVKELYDKYIELIKNNNNLKLEIDNELKKLSLEEKITILNDKINFYTETGSGGISDNSGR